MQDPVNSDSKNTAVPTILEIVRDGNNSTDVEQHRSENISIIGETHLVAGDNDKIVPVVKEKVEASDIVFLEFDPDSILAATYKEASVSESASSVAKKLAKEREKPTVFLDDQVSSPTRKFEQVGFTTEEALTAFGCQLGIRYFIERPDESPTLVIGNF
ncbi:hypothetical protein COV25_00920 [candidate division WWE3 bacterium CG10_big_fil_rev_8_21_14_0_10_35_32]|nr:MAG: hypothetical protein COV25_00920 [candidate division WWE3 bacterium CG10_big_fil_rev_8_21_14_0_10_35_32]